MAWDGDDGRIEYRRCSGLASVVWVVWSIELNVSLFRKAFGIFSFMSWLFRDAVGKALMMSSFDKFRLNACSFALLAFWICERGITITFYCFGLWMFATFCRRGLLSVSSVMIVLRRLRKLGLTTSDYILIY